MPRLTATTQVERRDRILDAAEQCFARKGFHAATMQDICAGAGVSAGAIYRYFPSKEALIAGIAERDRREIAESFAAIADSDDLFAGLEALARHYLVGRPPHKGPLMVEIGAESTRNPAVAAMCRDVDDTVRFALIRLFEAGKRRGQIGRDVDTALASTLLMLLGDGLFWRSAVDSGFDAGRALPGVMGVVAHLFHPAAVQAGAPPQAGAAEPRPIEGIAP